MASSPGAGMAPAPPPPDRASLGRAVAALYTSHDPVERLAADEWLQHFLRSDHAWPLSIELLRDATDLTSLEALFCARALHVLLRKSVVKATRTQQSHAVLGENDWVAMRDALLALAWSFSVKVFVGAAGGQAEGEHDLLKSSQDGLRRSLMHLTRAARFVPAPRHPVRFEALLGMRSQVLREIRGTACYVSAVIIDSHDGIISASHEQESFHATTRLEQSHVPTHAASQTARQRRLTHACIRTPYRVQRACANACGIAQSSSCPTTSAHACSHVCSRSSAPPPVPSPPAPSPHPSSSSDIHSPLCASTTAASTYLTRIA